MVWETDTDRSNLPAMVRGTCLVSPPASRATVSPEAGSSGLNYSLFMDEKVTL